MTHQEWLADRKQRAIEYLDRGNRQKAVGFILAETKVTPDSLLALIGAMIAMRGTIEEARAFILDFK
jgi:hypothetical protein